MHNLNEQQEYAALWGALKLLDEVIQKIQPLIKSLPNPDEPEIYNSIFLDLFKQREKVSERIREMEKVSETMRLRRELAEAQAEIERLKGAKE